MKKWLFMVICSLILLLPLKGFAHSYVSESSPADGETVMEAVDELHLLFNGGIEPFSTVTVKKDGEEIETGEIIIDSPSMYVEMSESLTAGTYEVEWQAIGSDTHLTEGQYSFTVDESVNASPEDEEPAEERQIIDDVETEETVSENEQAEESNAAENTDANEENTLLMIGALALITMIIIGVIVLRGRKK
ncbi:copper resistance protein CopC [Alkalihalophilus marmarensis]|uniref:copper resistance CopC family protein n=1 Tax=Alkalihalophilus marmarensis TaxID=521377 RepID=UPI002E2125B6|nr:copper resistance protein CopC [Alkalihalophilus marmarensis]MED1599683.1 copper resistance protein CopC [Alkalihalophilus marmarensis]